VASKPICQHICEGRRFLHAFHPAGGLLPHKPPPTSTFSLPSSSTLPPPPPFSPAACRPTSSVAAAVRPPPPSMAARGGSAPRPLPTASTPALTQLSSCLWSRQTAAARCWGAARRCGRACSPVYLASQTRSVWGGARLLPGGSNGMAVLGVQSHLNCQYVRLTAPCPAPNIL
jgi:hypothetical protein